MDKEYLMVLLREANRLGLKGKKVVGYIPNTDAGSVWPGAIIAQPIEKNKNATED